MKKKKPNREETIKQTHTPGQEGGSDAGRAGNVVWRWKEDLGFKKEFYEIVFAILPPWHFGSRFYFGKHSKLHLCYDVSLSFKVKTEERKKKISVFERPFCKQ